MAQTAHQMNDIDYVNVQIELVFEMLLKRWRNVTLKNQLFKGSAKNSTPSVL